LSQPLNRNFPPVPVMADIKILTENTAKITPGKKYSPRPPTADKHTFLAEMGPHRTDRRHIPDPAKTNFTLAAIDLTPSRTEHAGIHLLPQLLNGLTKRTDISRQRRHSFVSRIVFEAQQIYAELL